MDKFIEQHADRISGTLGCFDRVLFRGYLPMMSGAAMAAFLKSREVWGDTLKSFLLEQAERLKRHALDLCTREGRPYEYLSHATRKEDLARKIAECYEITEGLVCVLSVVEPCRTFSLVSERSLTVRSVGEAQVFEIWGSSTSSSRAGSRARFRSTSTATSGWLGNLTVTA